MWDVIKKYPLAAAAAIVAHVLFILLLTVTVNWSEDKPAGGPAEKIEVIKATAIDEKKIDAELQRLRDAEQRKQQQEQERIRKVQEQKRQEEQRLAEIKKKQEQEKKRLADLKKKREQEQQQRKLEEQQRVEEKKREEEKAWREKQAQELKAKLEAEARAQQREARLAGNQDEIRKYKRRINQKIVHNWKIPSSAQAGMVCEIMVRLLPSGDVASVEIIKSSGDPGFDSSVEKAVYSAAPLPVPSIESGLFEEFRELKFLFDPKNRL